MTDTPENQTDNPSPAPIPTDTLKPTTLKKSRGRPKSPTPETPQQRIERLQAELQEAHEAKEKLEQQRDSIVGKTVVAHALAHDDFRHQLATILRKAVKSKADLAAITELLT